MTDFTSAEGRIRPIIAAIKTVPIPPKPDREAATLAVIPFITISREAGGGAWTLAQQLVASLNLAAPEDQRWSCWDRELVGKVAADHRLSQRVIESFEESAHSWFADFLASLSFAEDPSLADESKIYQRVAATIRALAQSGRVVIVGRGGVFITRHMPGGIHVRLVAPLEHRIAFMSDHYHLTPVQAIARIKELDRYRQGFYKRYWPKEIIAPETFTITLNTADVAIPAIIQILWALVRQTHP